MRKRQRLVFICAILVCLAFATGLSLYALRDTVSYFMAPGELRAAEAAHDARIADGKNFRLGGLVKKGSLQKQDGELAIRFTVTDGNSDIDVEYKGILPDLFREGQGVVATGHLVNDDLFSAKELLAKHDEKYMPPELKKSLDKAHADGVKKMDADGVKKMESAP